MKNSTEYARKINDILDGFKMKAYVYQRELMAENKPITIDNFRLKWYGKSMERPRMLMEIFEQHNKQMTALANKEFSPLTLERYETSKRHIESFLKWKYKTRSLILSFMTGNQIKGKGFRGALRYNLEKVANKVAEVLDHSFARVSEGLIMKEVQLVRSLSRARQVSIVCLYFLWNRHP